MTTNGHDISEERSESYWVGHLAAAIDTAIRQPHIAKTHLKATLRGFRDSPACTPGLRNILDRRDAQ